MDINKEIGIRIKKLREKNQQLQKETADIISKRGVPLSDSQLGLYELGLRKVPNNITIALAEHFNVSTDYILTGKEPISSPIQVASSSDGIDLSEMSENDRQLMVEMYNRLKKKGKSE